MTCPEWCVYEPGHEDGDLVRYHDGPMFGRLVSIGGTEDGGPIKLDLHLDTPSGGLWLDAAGARALAAQLIAAAEWLEVHQ